MDSGHKRQAGDVNKGPKENLKEIVWELGVAEHANIAPFLRILRIAFKSILLIVGNTLKYNAQKSGNNRKKRSQRSYFFIKSMRMIKGRRIEMGNRKEANNGPERLNRPKEE